MNVWFCPNIASRDMLRLFSNPDAWDDPRSHVHTFKFYAQHLLDGTAVGPNTFEALRQADAFRKLQAWGIRTAIEMGAVKEWDCDAEKNVVNFDIAQQWMDDAGGVIDCIAMDEPLVSGRKCNQSVRETARHTAKFIKHCRARGIAKVGLIEAWRHTLLPALQGFLGELASADAKPDFLHLDVDWKAALAQGQPFDATQQRRARMVTNYFGMQLGVIYAGYDTAEPQEYVADVRRQAANIPPASFDHAIVQSWAKNTNTGIQSIPDNIPTHVGLISDIATGNLPAGENWKPLSFWQRLWRRF